MKDKREQLKSIFEDTMNLIMCNTYLHQKAQDSLSQTKCYQPDDYPAIELRPASSGNITVTRHSTFEAAQKLIIAYPEKRIAVLNFASATNPGGGVKKGSSAQEEALCRCSTLFPVLNQERMWDQYYRKNRAEHNTLHNDACIYSPSIIVFKTPTAFPVIMPSEEWFEVDVISCAAPNLRKDVRNRYNVESGDAVSVSDEELYNIHLKRAKHIMAVAAANKVDILVLGAFGCGAFANNPDIVARAFFDALKDYISYFDLVEFAVYCRPYETENFQAFYNACFGKHFTNTI